MRIACVHVPFFAVAIERRSDPALQSQPLVIFDHSAIYDSAPELAVPTPCHLTVRQLRARYPHAVFIEANHALYQEVMDTLLDALEHVVPLVEPSSPGTVYADASGLHGHYDDEFTLAATIADAVRSKTGLLPSTGIASGKFVAWVAASSVNPGDAGIVPQGQESTFLCTKETALLPLGAELTQRLEMLALRTLGDIAELPRPALEAQFGKSMGGQLWELSNGIDHEPFLPRNQQELITERMTLDAPIVATEALLAVAKQLLLRLMHRLDGRTTRRMHLQIFSEERIVWERTDTFREPVGDEHRILILLKTRLTLLELSQAVDTVSITLSGIGCEMAKQAKLFTDTQQNLNQIGEAIRQLRARYGRDMVGRVMEVDRWSRHPEERAVLVPYDV